MAPRIYILSGPNEDPATLKPTAPNPTTPTKLSSSTSVRVHIRDFKGVPAPETDSKEYFSHPNHNTDLFAIHFFFTPPEDIPGADLILANTFDRPIRDHLPYFFPAAWRCLQWVDPGIQGDCYSDKPEVFGSVLGSANYLSVSPVDGAAVIEEDMPEDVPQTAADRKKYFLDERRRKEWVWKKGQAYAWDFCNGMMDFNEISVRIPGLGFKIDVFKYWDGQPLRFTLKNKTTGEIYGCVVIQPREEEGMDVSETEESDIE
ncbi:hypothetical protein BZA77DRAFT_170804 [Pyronema omphalodes]|nr:hypothetical protein BZA77DRAFT_170804 [Pyronema omphalodes]